MSLNSKQKAILVIFALILTVLCVGYVPWLTLDKKYVGYAPIWSPPRLIKEKDILRKPDKLQLFRERIGVNYNYITTTIDLTRIGLEVFCYISLHGYWITCY